jgi:hypothetical protein
MQMSRQVGGDEGAGRVAVGRTVVGCGADGGATDVAGGGVVGDGRAGAVVFAGPVDAPPLAPGLVAEPAGEVAVWPGLADGRTGAVEPFDVPGVNGGMYVPGLAGSGG